MASIDPFERRNRDLSLLGEGVRRRIHGLTPYRPGRAAAAANFGKLSSNESPLGPSARAIVAAVQATRSLERYPSVDTLTQAIADKEGVTVEQVLVTNGTDELCYLLALLLVDRSTTVVVSTPGYAIDLTVTKANEGRIVSVPLLEGCHDTAELAKTGRSADLIWLPNPHNPTGTVVGEDQVEALLESVGPACIVVLDEAYGPFVDRHLRWDALALQRRYRNVFVQRTFSKAYGLAGLRIAYGIGDPELVAALQMVRPPFNVNAVAAAAAEAALADDAWLDHVVEVVAAERRGFEAFLEHAGIEFWPSQANFVTLRPPDLAGFQDALASAGLVARDGRDLGIEGWVRVSVGTPAEMAVLRDAITSWPTTPTSAP